jgi:hypothetical protein
MSTTFYAIFIVLMLIFIPSSVLRAFSGTITFNAERWSQKKVRFAHKGADWFWSAISLPFLILCVHNLSVEDERIKIIFNILNGVVLLFIFITPYVKFFRGKLKEIEINSALESK